MTTTDQQLIALYHSIDQRGRQQLRARQITGDAVLANQRRDDRRGLTLLATPPAHVARNIQYCLAALRSSFPELYYYPSTDLHITILDLLQATDHFQLSTTEFEHYRRLVAQVLSQSRPVEWTIKGVYLSPAGVLVGGFYSPNLTTIRDYIRQQCHNQGLPITERYQTTSGHLTVARFITPPTEGDKLSQAVGRLAQSNFGTFTSRQFSLVVHDWYNSQVDQLAILPIGQRA